jgi:hypothetical protein
MPLINFKAIILKIEQFWLGGLSSQKIPVPIGSPINETLILTCERMLTFADTVSTFRSKLILYMSILRKVVVGGKQYTVNNTQSVKTIIDHLYRESFVQYCNDNEFFFASGI